ncbi:hypothetical protein PG990_005020 [Apiospora arundinis]
MELDDSHPIIKRQRSAPPEMLHQNNGMADFNEYSTQIQDPNMGMMFEASATMMPYNHSAEGHVGQYADGMGVPDVYPSSEMAAEVIGIKQEEDGIRQEEDGIKQEEDGIKQEGDLLDIDLSSILSYDQSQEGFSSVEDLEAAFAIENPGCFKREASLDMLDLPAYDPSGEVQAEEQNNPQGCTETPSSPSPKRKRGNSEDEERDNVKRRCSQSAR